MLSFLRLLPDEDSPPVILQRGHLPDIIDPERLFQPVGIPGGYPL